MRIVCDRQQTEEWDRWRARPTASEFGSFITPVKGDYSKQATAYACKIIAKRLGVYTEPPPSYWMEYGLEMEPNAKLAYELLTKHTIQDVGFVLPDHTDAYGGSPDGLIGDEGIIEVKCPKPETLIEYHAAQRLPVQYQPQVQGLLLITGRRYCDFMAFHPELSPYICRVSCDWDYQAKIADGLLRLLDEIARIESRVQRCRHDLVSPVRDRMRWDDE